MGPKGHPKEVPWDQKVIPRMQYYNPLWSGKFSQKKLKIGNPKALGSGSLSHLKI